jgi:hypothetical protein
MITMSKFMRMMQGSRALESTKIHQSTTDPPNCLVEWINPESISDPPFEAHTESIHYPPIHQLYILFIGISTLCLTIIASYGYHSP